MSKDKLIALGIKIEAREIALSPEAARRILCLVNLAQRPEGDGLWRSDNPAHALLSAFPNLLRTGTQGGLGTVLAGVDTQALTEFEREVFDQATRGRSKSGTSVNMGGFFRRFFFPLYTPLKRMVDFNNRLRAHLDYADELNSLLNAVQAHPFEGNTLDEITPIAAEVTTQVNEVRNQMTSLYGERAIRPSHVVLTPIAEKFDIYRLAKSLPDLEEASEEVLHRLIALGEKICEALDASAPIREGKDYFDPELKIRNHQYRRQAGEATDHRKNIMADDTGLKVNVDYEWEETEHYWTTETTYVNGKLQTRMVQKSRTVTKYGSKTIELTFGDVLEKRLQLEGCSTSSPGSNGRITAVNDREGIVEASEPAAAVHLKVYNAFANTRQYLLDQIKNHTEHALQIFGDPQYKSGLLRNLDEQSQGLRVAREEIEALAAMSDAEILSQWSEDSVEHFRRRNAALLQAVDLHLRLLEIYREQVNRELTELRIEPTLANFDSELHRLWWRGFRARFVQVSTASAAFAFGGLSIYHGSVSGAWQSIVDGCNSLLSKIF